MFLLEESKIFRTKQRGVLSVNMMTNQFTYNAKSEVVGVNLSTVQYAYTFAYDFTGNHTASSVDSVETIYTANNLNQYSQISVPSEPSVENLSYDLDGNMVSNGAWVYSYDAENRLSAAYSNSVCVVSNAYDHMSRRVLKISQGGTETRRFVYDGWNVIQETVATASGTTTNHYVWGKDLSGSLQGAGGIGGLLAVNIHNSFYFPLADANGNITAYIDGNGAVVAEHTYDAFGSTIAKARPMADAFTFRFSTKYFDTETGLYYYYYYGMRFYDPVLHRWLNRDPIAENGGLNVHGFCANDGVNRWDLFGLSGWVYIKSDGKDNGQNPINVGGTSWIEYVPDCDRVLPNGAKLVKGFHYHIHNYGNLNGAEKKLGVNLGVPKGRVYTFTSERSAHIDNSGEDKLWNYIKNQRELDATSWNFYHNCATFASEAWNEGTGEYLSPANGKRVSDEIPDELLEKYVQSLQQENALKNVSLALIKAFPMNTPKNLADSIYKANGNASKGTKNEQLK